jgi:hypothetical protein
MSYSIDIPNGPESPNIGYYNINVDNSNNNPNNPNNYSYNTLISNLIKTCTNASNGQNINSVTGIYSDPTDSSVSQYLPDGATSLDIPFYLAKTGVLMDSSNSANLPSQIQNYCNSQTQNIDPIVNQIQYLTCQLEKERNKKYDSNSFSIINDSINLKDIFDKFSKYYIFMIIIFAITMYLFINGFFSSLDVGTNIFSIVSKSSESNSLNYMYWGGVLLGIIIPIIVLCVTYTLIEQKNLNELEKYEITNNPYGVINKISQEKRSIDYMTIILFIVVIYLFIAVLFTIKKSYFSKFIYIALISIILFIISIFIYVLYRFIPFLNSADDKNMFVNEQKLKLYIEQQNIPSNILTNQKTNLMKAFNLTFLCIAILAILFFWFGSKNSFLNGLLTPSSILIIPLLWVYNIIFAINYFYVYPILYIIIRIIRYIFMSIIYIISEKNSSFKDNFTDELLEQIDNFKNYSPSWGLIGVDEFKLFLNMKGYENIFSKIIVSDDNNTKNLSQNKFVSTLSLYHLINMFAKGETNTSGIAYSILIFILTIIVTVIILKGFYKI